jgi:hypothetical protein
MNEFEITLGNCIDTDIDCDRESRWEAENPQFPVQIYLFEGEI